MGPKDHKRAYTLGLLAGLVDSKANQTEDKSKTPTKPDTAPAQVLPGLT
jgi:hypothetical protein